MTSISKLFKRKECKRKHYNPYPESFSAEDAAKYFAHEYYKRSQLGLLPPSTEDAGYWCAKEMFMWVRIMCQNYDDFFDKCHL